jgi:hypothetical protein
MAVFHQTGKCGEFAPADNRLGSEPHFEGIVNSGPMVIDPPRKTKRNAGIGCRQNG